jgi:hypothetical protein
MLVALFFAWTGPSGVANPCYLLLYPVVFSIGLIFPPRISWVFTAGCLGVYAVLSPPLLAGDPKVVVVRLITLAAVCGLASLYWRNVRRRRATETEHEAVAPLAWQSAHAS